VTAFALTADGGVEKREIRFPVAHPLTRAGQAEPEVRRELLSYRQQARETAPMIRRMTGWGLKRPARKKAQPKRCKKPAHHPGKPRDKRYSVRVVFYITPE
jgi:hypothetical protein